MTQNRLPGKFSEIGGMYPAHLLISQDELTAMVQRLGKQITEDYCGKQILLVSILKGSFIFCSDLVRAIDLPTTVEFMACSSYGDGTSSSGKVKIIKDLDYDIKDKHVILVEDIVDTGLTLSKLKEVLSLRHPASLKICTAFDKPVKRKVELHPEYVGIEVPDEFIIGYGLDYQNYYRNLSEIYAARPVEN